MEEEDGRMPSQAGEVVMPMTPSTARSPVPPPTPKQTGSFGSAESHKVGPFARLDMDSKYFTAIVLSQWDNVLGPVNKMVRNLGSVTFVSKRFLLMMMEEKCFN